MMSDEVEEAQQRARVRRAGRMKKVMLDPVMLIAAAGVYLSFAMFVFPEFMTSFLSGRTLGLFIAGISILLVMSKYLGIFADEATEMVATRAPVESLDPKLLREIRNYLVHAPRSGDTQATQINIDEAFKGQLLARLTTESQSALASFIESEIFKKTAESRFKENEKNHITTDVDQMISTYQIEMTSWRKNANVNLLIGLVCAVVGIAVMWQTLVTLNFELESGTSWKITDLYRFLARFGLVLIIESVAFFFLKLYREDRSMIRYLRNEITNLESKCLSLKAALSFGSATDITKVLQSLSGTERNFLVKKGERVMSDISYENSEILLEKILGRYSELLGKVAKPASEKVGS
jgi:uncharacterized membrane protein